MPDYIVDTSVVSNFAVVAESKLIAQLYGGRAFTTLDVLDELKNGVKKGYSFLAPVVRMIEKSDSWLKIAAPSTIEEYRLREEFDLVLDSGESSCLVLALSRGMIFVSDDMVARKLAFRRNVQVSGTLGILGELVRAGALTLDQGNGILTGMIEGGYFTPFDRLDDLL